MKNEDPCQKRFDDDDGAKPATRLSDERTGACERLLMTQSVSGVGSLANNSGSIETRPLVRNVQLSGMVGRLDSVRADGTASVCVHMPHAEDATFIEARRSQLCPFIWFVGARVVSRHGPGVVVRTADVTGRVGVLTDDPSIGLQWIESDRLQPETFFEARRVAATPAYLRTYVVTPEDAAGHAAMLAARLRNAGVPVVSTWHDNHGTGWQRIREDLDKAEALVVASNGWSDAWCCLRSARPQFEIGFAAARRLRVVAYTKGEPPAVLYSVPAIIRCKFLDSVLEALRAAR